MKRNSAGLSTRPVLVVVVALIASASFAATKNDRYDAAIFHGDGQMHAGSFSAAKDAYLAALKLAPSKDEEQFVFSDIADAAFLGGDPQTARTYYAKARSRQFDDDLRLTKGTGAFEKFLGGALLALNAATDVANAQSGVTTTNAQDALSRMPNSTTAQRPKDYRKLVAQTSSSLTTFAKSPKGQAVPLAPNWSNVPGFGVVLLMSGDKSCPAVRADQGTYIAAASCVLSSSGIFPSPMLAVAIPALRRDDSCQVTDFWTRSGSRRVPPTANEGDWVVVAMPKDRYCRLLSDAPHTSRIYGYGAPGKNALVSVEFADQFAGLVPVGYSCDSESFVDCVDPLGHDSLIWKRYPSGDWGFMGFARPHAESPVAPYDVTVLENAISEAANVARAREFALQHERAE
jgi:hypothetical protein